jgi:hypothetical protein
MGNKFILGQEDGTVAGGNVRGDGAVDLQTSRSTTSQVASGNYSTIVGGSSCTSSGQYSISGGLGSSASNYAGVTFGNSNSNNSYGGVVVGGQNNTGGNADYVFIGGGRFNNTTGATNGVIAGGISNTVSSNFSTISGGQSNTASTNTYATVVGGLSNTSSGQYSVSGSQNSLASGANSIAIGWSNSISGAFSCGFGAQNIGTKTGNSLFGYYGQATIYGQLVQSSNRFTAAGDAQISNIISRTSSTLSSSSNATLYADGVSEIILPSGLNRMWNVQVSWVAVVTAITGTATGVTVGDTKTSTDLLAVARRSGTTTVSAHTSAATHAIETIAGSLTAANITYSAGASQEMAITFTGPTFAGGGSVTMRVVARVQLTEVAY